MNSTVHPKTSSAAPSPELMREVETLRQKFHGFLGQGRYSEALACCQRAVSIVPEIPGCYTDAAICCVLLSRWQEAVDNCRMALRFGPPTMSTLDLLSQAYACLGQYENARDFGLKALDMRLGVFDGPVAFSHTPAPMPPAPSPGTRDHNVIAFSLFGELPKYCEIAILNAEARAAIYPDWTCHFYLDESVPAHVIARLNAAGGRIVRVPKWVSSWPGQMWRFLAYDTPGLHRVIFRDADSLISTREASAVSAWIESGRRFHHMRDGGSHTELLLAGLWGCVAGSLPPMHMLLDSFCKEPLEARQFADQSFLRKLVWPYARSSLLQHDSMFGFLDPSPFPDGPPPKDFHVGICAAGPALSFPIEAPDGTLIDWTLVETHPVQREICSYTTSIRDNRLVLQLPLAWGHAYIAGNMQINYRSHR